MNTYILRPDRTRDGVLRHLIDELHALPVDAPWQIEIKRHRKSRTEDQNAALWGVAYRVIREHTGNDADDLHTYFCGEYFGWVTANVFGQMRRVPRRTTTKAEDGKRAVMTTIEFADFYSFIQQRCAETQGINVPDPDPFWRERMRGAA